MVFLLMEVIDYGIIHLRRWWIWKFTSSAGRWFLLEPIVIGWPLLANLGEVEKPPPPKDW